MFETYQVDIDKPMVVTCGGAVVAPLMSFAASLVTGNIVPVYDVGDCVCLMYSVIIMLLCIDVTVLFYILLAFFRSG